MPAMARPSRIDLQKLQADLAEMDHGPDRLAAAERGIRAAAIQDDPLAGFAFREDLLLNCCLLGQLQRAVPAMEWCLARCDDDPARFDITRVLFQYKWIVEELPRHLAYDAATIEKGLADVERRFAAAGWSRRGPLELRMVVAWTMRRLDVATAAFEQWRTAPHDEGSDCAACATALLVRHLVNTQQPAAAIEAASPLLSREQSCHEEPARCFARLQFAYLFSDMPEEAFQVHERSIEEVIEGPQFCDARAVHMLFLLITGNAELAGRLLEISIPQAIDSACDLSILHTCEIGELVLEVLRARRMDMPTLEPAPHLGLSSLSDWTAWMQRTSEDLGAAFDVRNGNPAYRDARDDHGELLEQLIRD
jgi:cellulose synthase operon protein C